MKGGQICNNYSSSRSCDKRSFGTVKSARSRLDWSPRLLRQLFPSRENAGKFACRPLPAGLLIRVCSGPLSTLNYITGGRSFKVHNLAIRSSYLILIYTAPFTREPRELFLVIIPARNGNFAKAHSCGMHCGQDRRTLVLSSLA